MFSVGACLSLGAVGDGAVFVGQWLLFLVLVVWFKNMWFI
jgi:hypothetical protein